MDIKCKVYNLLCVSTLIVTGSATTEHVSMQALSVYCQLMSEVWSPWFLCGGDILSICSMNSFHSKRKLVGSELQRYGKKD